jgi:2,3-dihydroxybenzoate-AMP ligase
LPLPLPVFRLYAAGFLKERTAVIEGCIPWPAETAQRYRQAGYWRGELLGDIVREPASAHPDRIAVVAGGQRLSFGYIDEYADRLAAGLLATGLSAGDRAVLQLPNSPDIVPLALAMFRAGILPVFALAAHRYSEISYLCQHAEASALIVPDVFQGTDYRQLARRVAASSPTVRHVVVAGAAQEFTPLAALTADPAASPAQPAFSPGDVAFFLLSGGTTGKPKLIPRTHDDYAYQLRACCTALGVDQRSAYLAALPVAHNAALGCPGVLGTIAAGGKAVLAATGSPDELVPLVAAEGVTLTTLMPPMLMLWTETADLYGVDLSRVLLQVGSAKLPPELGLRAMNELGAGLTHWFGMSEGLLTYTRIGDSADVVVHTTGRPLCPDDEIRVVDSNLRDVPPGGTGELLTRGPYTIRGYYRAPEQNARSFTADGYFRTGDLVRFTPEHNMIVEGRINDIINRGGEKISAQDLEQHLLTHPAIRDAVAVAVPDPVMGERTAAFVVPVPGQMITLSEVRRHLEDQGVAVYKMPDRLEVIDALPRTSVGKVNKSVLRQTAAAPAGAGQAGHQSNA